MRGMDMNSVKKTEPEHEGPIWKHPYMVYVMLNVVLFVFLLIAAYVAWTSGWIPERG